MHHEPAINTEHPDQEGKIKMKTNSHIVLASAILFAALADGRAQTTFSKITTGPIVTDRGQFVRGAWADFNNDGFLDLLVCNYGGTNVLYRNNGDGTFTKVTQGDPVADTDYHVAPDAADYDNDGFADLIVTGGTGAPTTRRNMLYRNNGDGTF